MTEPVYFIGGNFGSGGSAWSIAIITAITTAFLTFGVGLLHENHKRHLDRQALAASILAEITSLVELFDRLDIVGVYRRLREALIAGNVSAGTPDIEFPVTVYEKSADKVGTLGVEVGAGVVTFYNYLNGFRVCARIALNANLPTEGRINVIGLMLDMVESERSRIDSLRQKLGSIVIDVWMSKYRIPRL